MSVTNPKLEAWEKRLKTVFDEIDDYLENRYGCAFNLHPARSARNTTSNKAQDGLFNIGAAFSAGFGSRLGPGYIVEIRLVTLEFVPEPIRREITEEAITLLKEKLPVKFPDHKLNVALDNNVFKIYGDLSLGDA